MIQSLLNFKISFLLDFQRKGIFARKRLKTKIIFFL